MEAELLTKFQKIVGVAYLRTGPEIEQKYGSDETEDFYFPPDILILPGNTEELSKVLKLAYDHNLPITTRGGGTGLAGGALPIAGGLVISMERFNRILQIDEANLQVHVEPGVITEVLQNELQAKGLYYPPDPSSRGISFIGGNVATNAGGPRAVKYGVVKDYVLNLEVVLPNGDIIQTGANTLKNSTGYNLTQLFVGSEGTLGVITKIVLKLLPYPTHQLLLLVPFKNASDACAAVSAIFRAGIVPSALEFMERSAIDLARDYCQLPPLPLEDPVGAHLLIELDGFHSEPLYSDTEKIGGIVEAFGSGEILFADDEATKRQLWMLRRNVAHAVKQNSVYKEEDTVVPRAQLPQLLSEVKRLGEVYGFQSVCYGHAGDGNLHVNILKGSMDEYHWQEKLPEAIEQLFLFVRSLGGTISGEHGIGYVQKRYMHTVFSDTELSLLKGVKQVFDPKGLMNPGKIFPS